MRQLFVSRRSDTRLARARDFLTTLGPADDVTVMSFTFEAAAELTRGLGRPLFGWRRTTLFRCALELARPRLVSDGLAVATPLSLEALWARVAHELGQTKLLHRLAPLQGKPGLGRALHRTIAELRLLEVEPDAVEPALAEAMRAFDAVLRSARLVDRAQVLKLAAAEVSAWPSAPLVLVDVPVGRGLEHDFIDALAAHVPHVLAVAPQDDEVSTGVLADTLGPPTTLDEAPSTALGALQRNLFTQHAPDGPCAFEDFFSAPGEARECVELARRIVELAKQGVRFDEMAVLLRAPGAYRAPLEDAFRRANIKAHLASGSPRPDPSGRALLALLRCAEEGLSARRFNEYLSLSQVPTLDVRGAPPVATPRPFARPETRDSLLPLASPEPPPPALKEEVADPDAPAVLGQLRSPRRWERLIVEAAVIGGTDRWRRRLLGLRAGFERERRDAAASDAQLEHVDRKLADLTALEHFALPVLDTLARLPTRADWGEWLDALMALATRVLKDPARVVSVLHELSPMRPVGPLELSEVRAVLSARLSEVAEAQHEKRPGHVFVGPIESVRGLAFHTVFVPGLAERVFPQKIREDPLLADRLRREVHPDLERFERRIGAERLALMLAVGAATTRAVLSYPRIDVEHARPRVPSFYALEAARAVEGQLPAYEALQRTAEASAGARLAWPAPSDRTRAIDDTEFDLSTIDAIMKTRGPVVGRGRYLVTTNPHLGRALRARFARWQQRAWTPHDGLVKPGASARASLGHHLFGARSYSPTALEHFAACPYKFFLSAVVRLRPLDVPHELEELGPLEKGTMAHEVQFRLLSALRDDGVVITSQTLPDVLTRLHATIEAVAHEVFDTFKPAIERVWVDGVQTLEADLRQWLRRVRDDEAWKPAHFELGFGLSKPAEQQDPRSEKKAVKVLEGLQVRGSIDLVELHASGALRATDYKTGRPKVDEGAVVAGGRHLQPVLYGLVLEQLFPGVTVVGGRLYYMTQVGGFTVRDVPLDAVAKEAFGTVARAIRQSLETGFFPAAPMRGECTWCDFRPVCGPDEERRVVSTRKNLQPEVAELKRVRDLP